MEMEDEIEILEKLKAEIEGILEQTGPQKNQKQINENFLKIVEQSVILLGFFDQKKIENWKKNDKFAFLHFVPYLKNLLALIHDYTSKVAPSLKHFYTDEIATEIDILNKDIARYGQELDSDFETISLREKEKLEQEYERLQVLLKERDELIKKDNILKSFDIEGIRLEIGNLTERISLIKAEIEPLKFERSQHLESLENYNKLIEDIGMLKNAGEQSALQLIDKIEEALDYIRQKHLTWNQDKTAFESRLKEELLNLKKTEEEIKQRLSELSAYRDAVAGNRDILGKHFSSNRKIINSLPAIQDTVKYKIKRLEDQLAELDSEIGKFLEVNQKITDETIRNPIGFDYQ